MKRLAPLALAALLAVSPVRAEETSNGLSLMEQGARQFLRGLIDQAEPAMEEFQRLLEGMEPAMRQFLSEMGPALSDLLAKVDDLANYHPPEMLPNGDIILRRRAPATPPPLAEGEIEL